VPTSTVGRFTFKLTATDNAGSVSNVLTGSFRIVAASDLAAVVTPTGQSPQSLIAAGGLLYWSEVGDNPVRGWILASSVSSTAPRARAQPKTL
jgi:hypothetical protein